MKCAMPQAVPPRPACKVQCAHCKLLEQRQKEANR